MTSATQNAYDAPRCAKIVRRPFGDPEPYRDVPCGAALPCPHHPTQPKESA